MYATISVDVFHEPVLYEGENHYRRLLATINAEEFPNGNGWLEYMRIVFRTPSGEIGISADTHRISQSEFQNGFEHSYYIPSSILDGHGNLKVQYIFSDHDLSGDNIFLITDPSQGFVVAKSQVYVFPVDDSLDIIPKEGAQCTYI